MFYGDQKIYLGKEGLGGLLFSKKVVKHQTGGVDTFLTWLTFS